jgi:hypothetical protein
MKIKLEVRSVLQEAWISESLVEVKRKRFNSSSTGFVIDISEEWLLLHIVNGDLLQFNGYEALRLGDISSVDKKDDWVTRAKERLGLQPVLQPDVLLVDLPGLLSSVNSHFPIIGLEREKIVPDALHIGRIENLRKKSVSLRELGVDAQWYSRDIRHRLKDITRVSFGDTYMRLLMEFARSQEAGAAN